MPRPERSAARPRVLVVDDHVQMAEMLADGLTDRGFAAAFAPSAEAALARLRAEHFDALVTDLRMEPMDGLALVTAARQADPDRPVIVMTAYGAVDSAVESIRRGAYHYLTKPFKIEELEIFLRRALDERGVRREATALRLALRDRAGDRAIVGDGPAMQRVFDVIERVVDADVPVLLLGETGTGKGLLARELHARGQRAAKPFVSVNCAALPEALLESELFGHTRGAFTGAVAERAGLFVDADGGTLLLDEIGDMALALQAKLLHVIERGTVRPVGESRERSVDVRIVAATHRDLHAAVARGQFREDLLYRLDVVTLELPPLRSRGEDIPALLDHFLRAARARYPQSPVRALSTEVVEHLARYRWPGNVRELAHLIERLVLLGRAAEVMLVDLPAAVRTLVVDAPEPRFAGEVLPVRELQRQYALWALAELGNNRSRTAERLGIDRGTLARWLTDEPDDASKE